MKNSKKTMIFRTALAGLAMLLTFAAAPARAAAPELISFQGKLTDSANNAVSSVVSMVFKLYTDDTGGVAVWQETQNVTPDAGGIYNVLLGTVTPFNVSFSTAYWLGVAVGGDAEMTPRYQLVSSAYSLYAVNSGTAAWAVGADWSGITNKPAIGTGDAVLSATQIFTGRNTFARSINTNNAYQINGSTVIVLFGSGSLAVGVDAGRSHAGNWNAFMGYQAGMVNTGYDNVFVGYQAGLANTSGIQNSFVGQSAGYSNTTASQNSFVGSQAGNQNTTGENNSFFGSQTGYRTTTGGENSFFGYVTGYNNTTGVNNSVFGSQAAYSNVTGSANSIFGYFAGFGGGVASYSSSTLMGYHAGRNLTTGSNNILLGWQAGDSLTTGSDNIIIGYNADAPLNTTANYLNIGGVIYGNLATRHIAIGAPTLTSTFTVVGTFMLQDGTQGAGKVLISNASGLASWGAVSAGDAILAATQTFTGQNTFSYGVFFSSTIQSAGSVDGIYGPGVAGNSRGANAVDLQVYRDNAVQVASGNMSVIGGGMGNTANNEIATVSGGANNTASGAGATVAGGGSNTASGTNAAVAGGNTNTASGQFTTVAGGASNTASGNASTVAGGEYNNASGQYAIAAGGQFNSALGDFSFAAGKASSSTAAGAFTWGDSQIGGGIVLNNVADRTWFKNRGGFLISTATVASGAAFAVDSAGKVGIGTTNPGAVLEVNGNILFSQGAARTLSVATTITNSSGTNLTIAAGTAQQSGVLAYPGGNLYLSGGGAYSMGAGNNWGGSIFLYGGNGQGGGPSGDVILAHDGSNPKGNVGIGTNAPGVSSLLELASTSKGFVLPRMTKAQRDAISAKVAGMMVYQTDNTPGLRVYNGTNWMRFTETAD